MADTAGLTVKVPVQSIGLDKVVTQAVREITYADFSEVGDDDNKGGRSVCPMWLLGVPTVRPCRDFHGTALLRHLGGKTHCVLPPVWTKQYFVAT